MSDNGENYDFFYLCFFLDIFKFYQSLQVVLNTNMNVEEFKLKFY
jgi:hypothetical protein